MSQRISLTRIIALNWYGFRQIFDVSDNILISGGFGTGKSALLDLIQYVLLGEHWRANRAAAGNARGRDVVGYCLGDTNQTRNGQRHFLRPGGVTIVALEFTRPAERGRKESKRETWGVRLEYSSPDAAPKQTYFCVPERLEYAQLAPDGKSLLGDDEFRTWLRREYGNESLFARQRDYLEEMAAPRHLNFDVAAFQRTFPKAIAFEPDPATSGVHEPKAGAVGQAALTSGRPLHGEMVPVHEDPEERVLRPERQPGRAVGGRGGAHGGLHRPEPHEPRLPAPHRRDRHVRPGLRPARPRPGGSRQSVHLSRER